MPIASEDDIDWTETERADAHFRRKQLGRAAGGRKLGCSLYEIPPGGRSWPYHYHEGNEEAVYVLAGRGTLRTPDDERTVAAGDYVALPPGAEGGHRLHNDGDETLRFLMVSTMETPDVTVYPDADAFGVYTGTPPGGDADERPFQGYFPREAEFDYWEDIATAGSDDGSGSDE